MEFSSSLIEGRLIKRYKRFLADVALPDGTVVCAHCPNSGTMKTCAPQDARVWISPSTNPKRKLKFTWELVEVEGRMVCVNTHLANSVVEEGIQKNKIRELQGHSNIRREVKYGENSRIDLLLEKDDEKTWVEVKSVTLDVGNHISAFPDAVTTRGTKHLRELMKMKEKGDRAVLLFCVNRSETKGVKAAEDIDPTYAKTLREAAGKGVEILAYGCEISNKGVWLEKSLPVYLEGPE